MKCTALEKGALATAYKNAKEDAAAQHNPDVTMDHLAPHLKAASSSCGACPALLTLARSAFEGREDGQESVNDAVFAVPDLKTLEG